MLKPETQGTADLYISFMETLKKQNREYQSLLASPKYCAGARALGVKRNLLHPIRLVKKFSEGRRFKKLSRTVIPCGANDASFASPDYFHTERIAIYTCITGGYEQLKEPVWCPDNCDFYVITDREVSSDSAWRRLDIADMRLPENLTSAERNRYCKMFPHRLPVIGDYKYSVYIDGKIIPYSDLTEFVNRIGESGMAFHRHTHRNCAYDEAAACLLVKKENKERIQKTIAFLESEEFPRNYGLLECCCIARAHESETMQDVMTAWWEAFMQYAKRDQLTLPCVLYKRGIRIEDVATLGYDVFANDAVRVAVERN